jgi:hypothetical protein
MKMETCFFHGCKCFSRTPDNVDVCFWDWAGLKDGRQVTEPLRLAVDCGGRYFVHIKNDVDSEEDKKFLNSISEPIIVMLYENWILLPENQKFSVLAKTMNLQKFSVLKEAIRSIFLPRSST